MPTPPPIPSLPFPASHPPTHLDGLDLLVELLVDLKGLLKEAELDRFVGDRGAVEVVQAVDEVLDLWV